MNTVKGASLNSTSSSTNSTASSSVPTTKANEARSAAIAKKLLKTEQRSSAIQNTRSLSAGSSKRSSRSVSPPKVQTNNTSRLREQSAPERREQAGPEVRKIAKKFEPKEAGVQASNRSNQASKSRSSLRNRFVTQIPLKAPEMPKLPINTGAERRVEDLKAEREAALAESAQKRKKEEEELQRLELNKIRNPYQKSESSAHGETVREEKDSNLDSGSFSSGDFSSISSEDNIQRSARETPTIPPVRSREQIKQSLITRIEKNKATDSKAVSETSSRRSGNPSPAPTDRDEEAPFGNTPTTDAASQNHPLPSSSTHTSAPTTTFTYEPAPPNPSKLSVIPAPQILNERIPSTSSVLPYMVASATLVAGVAVWYFQDFFPSLYEVLPAGVASNLNIINKLKNGEIPMNTSIKNIAENISSGLNQCFRAASNSELMNRVTSSVSSFAQISFSNLQSSFDNTSKVYLDAFKGKVPNFLPFPNGITTSSPLTSIPSATAGHTISSSQSNNLAQEALKYFLRSAKRENLSLALVPYVNQASQGLISMPSEAHFMTQAASITPSLPIEDSPNYFLEIASQLISRVQKTLYPFNVEVPMGKELVLVSSPTQTSFFDTETALKVTAGVVLAGAALYGAKLASTYAYSYFYPKVESNKAQSQVEEVIPTTATQPSAETKAATVETPAVTEVSAPKPSSLSFFERLSSRFWSVISAISRLFTSFFANDLAPLLGPT